MVFRRGADGSPRESDAWTGPAAPEAPGWWAPLGPRARTFEGELARELHPIHPLAGIAVRALGKSDRNDDVLFGFPDDERVALVHLTWSGKPERLPFPHTTIYPTFDAFIAANPADD